MLYNLFNIEAIFENLDLSAKSKIIAKESEILSSPGYRMSLKIEYQGRETLNFQCPTCGEPVKIPIPELSENSTVPACPKCGPRDHMIYDPQHIDYLKMENIII